MYEKKIKKNITKKAPKCISTIFKRKKRPKNFKWRKCYVILESSFRRVNRKTKE
jgi:hypothetical protein